MIRNIETQNIFDIIGISNLWNLINVLIKKTLWKKYFNVSCDFSKFNGSKKIKLKIHLIQF
jgi:hypothetical protein